MITADTLRTSAQRLKTAEVHAAAVDKARATGSTGYKQLAGRANYREIGQRMGLDLEGNPELARQPAAAARGAVAFWAVRDRSPLAGAGDIESVTARVNGPARLGLAERRAATVRALDI